MFYWKQADLLLQQKSSHAAAPRAFLNQDYSRNRGEVLQDLPSHHRTILL